MREFFSTAAEEAVRSGYLYQKGPCGSTVFNFREAVMKSDRQRIGYHSATDPAAAPAPAPTAAPIGPATKAPVTPPAAPPATTFCVWVQPTKSSAVKAAASTSSFIPIPSSRRECPSARLSESKRSDHWRKLARERQRSKRQRERDGEALVAGHHRRLVPTQ